MTIKAFRFPKPFRTAQYAFLSVALVFAVFPVIWIVSAAFNPSGSLYSGSLIPPNADLSNFRNLSQAGGGLFYRWILNSLLVSSVTAVLAVFLTGISAYAFSRFRFKFRRQLLMTILLVQVFPPMLTMVALFLLLQILGAYIPMLGLNTFGGLILVYLGGQMGINIWFMKGFFDSIPIEIDESAHVEGASYLQTFVYLTLPLARPIMAVIGLLVFIGTFGEFVMASIFMRSNENYTLMVGLYLYISDPLVQRWGVFAAGSLIASVPVVILYLALQDSIVSGLTRGAVKG
ncbi:sugar ABC transporter permease [Spirochaeta dissipatitropha]